MGEQEGYVSVTESVGATATSTREGHGSVEQLLGYSLLYHDRTGYASVVEVQTFREPVFDLVSQPILGWGVPLEPRKVLVVYRGSAEGTASVIENLGSAVPTGVAHEAHATVTGEVVAPS